MRTKANAKHGKLSAGTPHSELAEIEKHSWPVLFGAAFFID